MFGCLQTRVRKQPINVLYYVSENELKFYNLKARYPDTSAYLIYIKISSQLKYVLGAQKNVTLRWFFWAPKHILELKDKRKRNNFAIRIFAYLDLWRVYIRSR